MRNLENAPRILQVRMIKAAVDVPLVVGTKGIFPCKNDPAPQFKIPGIKHISIEHVIIHVHIRSNNIEPFVPVSIIRYLVQVCIQDAVPEMPYPEREIHPGREIVDAADHTGYVSILPSRKDRLAGSRFTHERISKLSMVVLPVVCRREREPVAEPVSRFDRGFVKGIVWHRPFRATEGPGHQQSFAVIGGSVEKKIVIGRPSEFFSWCQ